MYSAWLLKAHSGPTCGRDSRASGHRCLRFEGRAEMGWLECRCNLATRRAYSGRRACCESTWCGPKMLMLGVKGQRGSDDVGWIMDAHSRVVAICQGFLSRDLSATFVLSHLTYSRMLWRACDLGFNYVPIQALKAHATVRGIPRTTRLSTCSC